MAQLVRALPSHGRGHRFESCYAHLEIVCSVGSLDTDHGPRATVRATEAALQARRGKHGTAHGVARQRRCRLTTYAPGMTKTRTHTVRVSGHVEDDVRAVGCGYNGRSPLVPAVRDIVVDRAMYRCSSCGQHVGKTTEYVAEATGEMVVLFAGRDGAGRTLHTFLMPDLGRDPAAACTRHGALTVTRTALEATVLRSRGLQAGEARNTAAERTTITVHLRPRVRNTPGMSINQRAGSTAGDSAVH